MRKKFPRGKVITVIDIDLDTTKIEVVKYHPHVQGSSGYTDKIMYSCEAISESSSNLQYLVLAFIAKQNLGLNQYTLVAGVARALGVKTDDNEV